MIFHLQVVQPQADPNQWNGGGYYGYTAGYDAAAAAAAYGYAQPAQDPNLYYAGYAGYGNYPPQQQQQQVFPNPFSNLLVTSLTWSNIDLRNEFYN